MADTPSPKSERAPPYAWRCGACESANDSGVVWCAKCGIAAYSPGKAIAKRASELRPPPPPSSHDADAWPSANDLALFFPEGLLAGLTVLALPIWLIRLLYNGAYGAAASLFALAGIGIALCVAAFRERNKWVLYIGVVFILLGGWSAL